MPVTRAVKQIEEKIFTSRQAGKDVASVVTSWTRSLASGAAIQGIIQYIHHDQKKGVNTTGEGTAIAVITKDKSGKLTLHHDGKQQTWDEKKQQWV
jgi:hypothetical protein